MSDKIEIDVRVNGKTAKLSDVSDETIANIKKAEVKPIEHGDYGYLFLGSSKPRFFFELNGKIAAYNKYGNRVTLDANRVDLQMFPKSPYCITGNIFKDMEESK